jgi:selenocysteine-specific elongation factor
VQHVKILTLLGVRECILVLNKIDLADSDQKEIALLEAEELLDRFGITVVAAIPFSCAGDAFAETLKTAIVRHVLALARKDRLHDDRGTELPAFLSIDRVFSKAGHGAVVTGTLVRGAIKVGDEVKIEPGAIEGRVRGLQTFSHKLETAYPGQRLAINIALKENKPIERGQAVVGETMTPVRTMIVQLTDLGGLESGREVAGEGLKPQNVRFYHGTAERYGNLRWIQPLSAEIGTSGGRSGESDRADLRQAMIGQLSLSEPVVAGAGDRFVIRYGDYGIAGGEILLTGRPRWLSRAIIGELSEKIWSGRLEEAALAFLGASPQRSLSLSAIAALLPDWQRQQVVGNLIEAKEVEKLGDQLITRREKQELVGRVLEALQKAAQSDAANGAVSQEKLKVRIAPLVDRLVFQNIIKDLIATNQVVKIDEKLALASLAVPSKADVETLTPLMTKIVSVLSENFCIEISELVKLAGARQDQVMDALAKLEKQGKAFVINYEFAASSESILKAHRALASIWQRQRNISPGDFREELGTSRKYAMALLAYFDDHQITRRLQSGRVLLKSPGA